MVKQAFSDSGILPKPGFKVKFAEFPAMIIMAKSSLYLEDFQSEMNPKQQEKESFLLGKNREELKPFGKGKSSYFKATASTMHEYLSRFALIVQLKDFQHSDHRIIGKSLLNMDMFLTDVKHVIADPLERFRRNTFKLVDKDNACVGWFDMSISILQRPSVYLSKEIVQYMNPHDALEVKTQIQRTMHAKTAAYA